MGLDARQSVMEALDILRGGSQYFANYAAKNAKPVLVAYQSALADLTDNAIVEAAHILIREESDFSPAKLRSEALSVQETDRRLRCGREAEEEINIPEEERITDEQRDELMDQMKTLFVRRS